MFTEIKIQANTVQIWSLTLMCLPLTLFNRMCAPVMVELEGETDPLQIAMKELK